MTSRERVLAALAKQETDRVPRLLYEEAIGYTPPVARMLGEHCSPLSPRDFFHMDITHVALQESRLSRERFREWLGARADGALQSGQVDEWGVWWRMGDFHHFADIESPLTGIDDLGRLKDYPWPDLDESYRYEGLRQRVAALQSAGFAVAAFAGSVFEQSWYLRGMESMMMDMLAAPEFAHYMFERTAAFQARAAREFARAGVDIVITGDDVAGQRGLLMSAGAWREYLKPRLAATIKAVKEVNSGCAVFYHSDGNIGPLIPELIEVGVDILNPIQPECMDPAQIKREYGDRLAFWGTVSVQRTMPLGTPADVKAEVRARVREVGHGGGFILAPAHVLGPEVPWENIVAFFEAADEIEPNKTTIK